MIGNTIWEIEAAFSDISVLERHIWLQVLALPIGKTGEIACTSHLIIPAMHVMNKNGQYLGVGGICEVILSHQQCAKNYPPGNHYASHF